MIWSAASAPADDEVGKIRPGVEEGPHACGHYMRAATTTISLPCVRPLHGVEA
jgi:hypothetical protein